MRPSRPLMFTTDLKSEIKPAIPKLAWLLVENRLMLAKVLRDFEHAGDIANGQHRTVIRAIATLGAILLPLGDDQPRRHDGKIFRKEHAEGKLVEFVFFRGQFFGFQQLRPLAVTVPVDSGFKYIPGANRYLRRAVARPKNVRLHLHRAGSKPVGVPHFAQGGRFKTIVDINERRGGLGAGNAG